MNFDECIRAGMATMEDPANGGITFLVDGVPGEFTGTFDQTVKAQNLQVGGYLVEIDSSIVASRAQFGTLPRVGASLRYKSSTYVIKGRNDDSNAVTFFLQNVDR